MISISVILSPAGARFGQITIAVDKVCCLDECFGEIWTNFSACKDSIRSLPPIMIDVVLYLYETRALVICDESLNVFYCQPLSMLM